MQEADWCLEDEDVVMIRGAAHKRADVLDRVAEFEAEALEEERPGDGQVCGAQHRVAELAGLDPLGTQHTRCPGTGPLNPAGAVVGDGARGYLGNPGSDLDGGPHAGRLLDRRDGMWSASGLDPEATKPVADPGDVVGVVRTDIDLHQSSHWRVHDPQLPASVAGAKPAVALRAKPERGVVRGGFGDVR